MQKQNNPQFPPYPILPAQTPIPLVYSPMNGQPMIGQPMMYPQFMGQMQQMPTTEQAPMPMYYMPAQMPMPQQYFPQQFQYAQPIQAKEERVPLLSQAPSSFVNSKQTQEDLDFKLAVELSEKINSDVPNEVIVPVEPQSCAKSEGCRRECGWQKWKKCCDTSTFEKEELGRTCGFILGLFLGFLFPILSGLVCLCCKTCKRLTKLGILVANANFFMYLALLHFFAFVPEDDDDDEKGRVDATLLAMFIIAGILSWIIAITLYKWAGRVWRKVLRSERQYNEGSQVGACKCATLGTRCQYGYWVPLGIFFPFIAPLISHITCRSVRARFGAWIGTLAVLIAVGVIFFVFPAGHFFFMIAVYTLPALIVHYKRRIIYMTQN